MNAILTRIRGDKETLGSLDVLKEGKVIYSCKTLELPWKDNEHQVSCIPVGDYDVVKRISEKYGEHFWVLDIPYRSVILIHAANFISQLRGCIAVGKNHIDINKDELKDVTSSILTLKELLSILPDKFKLKIQWG